jgi:hypothetical protein
MWHPMLAPQIYPDHALVLCFTLLDDPALDDPYWMTQHWMTRTKTRSALTPVVHEHQL